MLSNGSAVLLRLSLRAVPGRESFWELIVECIEGVPSFDASELDRPKNDNRFLRVDSGERDVWLEVSARDHDRPGVFPLFSAEAIGRDVSSETW